MPSDTPPNDLLALAGLAPLVGGIAIEALALNRRTPLGGIATPSAGAIASDIVNRAERIHDFIMRPGATDPIINQECADLCAILMARIIATGGLPS